MLRRIVREPLLHFALLGGALFWLHARIAPEETSRTIRLSAADVQALRVDHQRRLGTTASAAEDEALVARFVDDEVLYREALSLGLDRGDIIVRRRMLQKMEFLLDGLHPLPEPSDAELEAYATSHAERYRTPARVSLIHVFVGRDRHGDRAHAVATELRRSLVAGGDPEALGDPFLRGRVLRAQSEQDLGGIFGPAFARAALALPLGEWSEPVTSSYGLHLVRVSERIPAAMPPLARIRAAVRQDWANERRAVARRAALAELRDEYDVRVERPPDDRS